MPRQPPAVTAPAPGPRIGAACGDLSGKAGKGACCRRPSSRTRPVARIRSPVQQAHPEPDFRPGLACGRGRQHKTAMRSERRVLIWMCALVGVNQLGFGGIVPVLPLYAQSFGVSASAVGLTIAVYGLARFAVAVPSGYLSDLLGRRPTLAVGGAITAFGKIGRAHVRTPVTNAHLVCRLLLEKKKKKR